MQVIAASQHRKSRPGLRPGAVIRFVIPGLFLFYAVYQFSMAQLVLLVLGGSLVAALFFRIGNLGSVDADDRGQTFSRAGLDGGSFHHRQPATEKPAIGFKTMDGGSFGRARPKSRT